MILELVFNIVVMKSVLLKKARNIYFFWLLKTISAQIMYQGLKTLPFFPALRPSDFEIIVTRMSTLYRN